MKLIDKDAVVAEIEKLQLCTMDEHMNYYSAEAQGEYNALSKLESFLDTLEVKEVDLDKEIEQSFIDLDYHLDAYNRVEDYVGENIDMVEYKRIAKHFYELGLKVAQKGEKV
jgi:hypothetical protein